MNKIYLIIFALLFCVSGLVFPEASSSNLFSKYTRLYFYSDWNFQKSVDEEITLYSEKDQVNENKISLKNNKNNVRLTFPFADFRINTTNSDNFTYGFSIFSEKYFKQFPLTLKVGNIKNSGAVSKMNNPLLSESASPFSLNSTTVSFLSSTLPSSVTSNNSLSLFYQSGYSSKKGFFRDFNISGWHSPETDIYICSGFLSLAPSKRTSLQFSCTGGTFPYEENTFSSWFSATKKYYHKDQHFCGNFQTAFNSPYVKNLFSAFVYESPFGSYNWIFRNENQFKSKSYILTFSELYNYNENFFTSSEKNINPCLQFKTGLQHKFNFSKKGPLFVKTGINTYTKINLLETQQDLLLGAGFQLSSIFYSLTLITLLDENYELIDSKISLTFNNVSLQLKNNWNFKRLNPSINLKSTFKSQKDNSYSFIQNAGCSVHLLNYPKITFSTDYSATFSNGELSKWNLKSDIKGIYSLKLMTITGKLSIVFFRG